MSALIILIEQNMPNFVILLFTAMHDHTNHIHSYIRMLLPACFSFILLLAGILFDHFNIDFFQGSLRIIWFSCAYLPVGIPVIREAIKYALEGDSFTEFSLMAIATIGAFCIGEYPEAVSVMLFYSIGEFFQDLAVKRAESNIKDLIDQRPDTVSVRENGETKEVKAKEVAIGTIIHLKPGDRLALDGELISEKASFNTSALTGESKPDTKQKGENVLAGMINLNTPAEIKVTRLYEDSKLSKILELVQEATQQKAPTELFIRKFAHYYTPSVVVVAVLICVLPLLIVHPYVFSEWLYRALIFLVISCPCALVISIPLSYFGGIGAASHHGILFKGSNYLDLMASIQNVVMDKTGTLTKGVFEVKKIAVQPETDENYVLILVKTLESHSSHPIATAIVSYKNRAGNLLISKDVEEITGCGLSGVIDGKKVLAGNTKLLDKFRISYNIPPEDGSETIVAIAIDNKFAGYIILGDQLKEDAKTAIDKLKEMGIKTTMLSGDKDTVVQKVAQTLGIDQAFGNLLPEDKVSKVQAIIHNNETVAFVGDGINDAPVIAISHAGIAMGGLGSDAAIEIADIVIQNDEPSKIPVAIRIGKATSTIVWQNIVMAFSIKLAVLALGAGGLATMWEAVFADVGVALLAILNAMRIQRKKFNI